MPITFNISDAEKLWNAIPKEDQDAILGQRVLFKLHEW